MSNIPLARTTILEALKLTDDPMLTRYLRLALKHMHREQPVRKASPHARHMTREIAQQIRTYAPAHPDECMRTIGRRFGVDGGRVSEALNGKW